MSLKDRPRKLAEETNSDIRLYTDGIMLTNYFAAKFTQAMNEMNKQVLELVANKKALATMVMAERSPDDIDHGERFYFFYKYRIKEMLEVLEKQIRELKIEEKK